MRDIKVADEIWVAAALLHREHPTRPDFSVAEIVGRVERQALSGRLRPGVYVAVLQHCVANLPPSPGRWRLLTATGRARRRLFRPGDPFDPRRDGSKTVPAREALPDRYRDLLDWYHGAFLGAGDASAGAADDPLLSARGLGRALASSEHPDDHVRRLRDSW
jgi:hypothetical protein